MTEMGPGRSIDKKKKALKCQENKYVWALMLSNYETIGLEHEGIFVYVTSRGEGCAVYLYMVWLDVRIGTAWRQYVKYVQYKLR